MAWSYRKRIKIAKGVNLNLSKNNIALSVGPKGLRTSVCKKGVHQYTSIPQTGLYSRKRISNKGCFVILLLPITIIGATILTLVF